MNMHKVCFQIINIIIKYHNLYHTYIHIYIYINFFNKITSTFLFGTLHNISMITDILTYRYFMSKYPSIYLRYIRKNQSTDISVITDIFIFGFNNNKSSKKKRKG